MDAENGLDLIKKDPIRYTQPCSKFFQSIRSFPDCVGRGFYFLDTSITFSYTQIMKAKQTKSKRPAHRPRSVTPPMEDMIALGEEMVKWVKERPKTLHLSEWYTIEKGYTYNQWKTFIQKTEFLPHYERATKMIALRYLDGTINPTIASRFLRNYFGDLTERENKDADADADRKKSIEATKPAVTNVYVKSDGLGSGIKVSTPPLSDSANQGSK